MAAGELSGGSVLQGRIKIQGSGPPVGPAKSPEEREVGPGKTFSVNASSLSCSPTYVSSTLPRLSLSSLDACFPPTFARDALLLLLGKREELPE